jgi:recombination protein RecR
MCSAEKFHRSTASARKICASPMEKRLATEPIKEIIIALGTDVEGDATSNYLAKRLARGGLKISRIAYGLPAGSGLEYADELTLNRALEGRREMH